MINNSIYWGIGFPIANLEARSEGLKLGSIKLRSSRRNHRFGRHWG